MPPGNIAETFVPINADTMGPTLHILNHRLIVLFLLLQSMGVAAQITIHGTVLEKSSDQPIIGAHVCPPDLHSATVTDVDGTFTIEADSLPVRLRITYIGYDSLIVVVAESTTPLLLHLSPSSQILKVVEIKGDARSDKEKRSALNVESIGALRILQIPSPDFYEGLSSMKGVDALEAAMGFTIINTRGFASTSPVRSLQIIDGIDNQSPGLNFSLGNFLGAPELDVLKVELIQGPVSSYYGPNAFNGVIDIRTKDPFYHQGLDVTFKYGERNLFKGEFRYAKAFKNARGREKFAFKINGAFMQANDWEATNYDPTDQSPDDRSNPGGYDAVNIYGDEFNAKRDYTDPVSLVEYPGLNRFYRNGYAETDLVDYNTRNIKGNTGVYYRLDSTTQLIGGFNFGSGTTIYQAENRFRLKDIFFWQGKLELQRDGKFFLRAYTTHEDAGESYDAYATALYLQSQAKTEDNWTLDYRTYWYAKFVPPPIPPRTDTLQTWHAQAQAYANSNTFRGDQYYQPGTARFDSMFNLLTTSYGGDPDHPGTRYYDKSALYHVHSQYQFSTAVGNLTLGASFRQYNPDSKGTIFSDTSGHRIINREFGVYGGIERDISPDKLKAGFTIRLDKNQNFNPIVSPAASIVYTPDAYNTMRISVSSALRNPTLTDQYLYLNVGRAILAGNISGYDSLITPESLENVFDGSWPDLSKLEYFNEPPVQPEKARSVELGYRGAPFNQQRNLWVDAAYYRTWYDNFLGYKIGITTDFNSINLPVNTQVWRISANAKSKVSTQGITFGTSYLWHERYHISGNYSWNVLNKKGTDDPLIPAFNTPEHKFNIGFGGSDIPLPLVGDRKILLGFQLDYKWIQGFLFEGSPQFTGMIPTYDLLGAQVNWTIQHTGVTVKVGGTNVLNKKQYQVYGGPRVGRLMYVSVLYSDRARKRN